MTEAERQLVAFVNDTDSGLREEFAVRFEQSADAIEKAGLARTSSVNEGRDLLHEALHENTIRRLRKLIGPVVKGRNRVAILIDNLDKAWDRQADLDAVSHLLLGLLSAVGQVSVEYQKEDFCVTVCQFPLQRSCVVISMHIFSEQLESQIRFQ